MHHSLLEGFSERGLRSLRDIFGKPGCTCADFYAEPGRWCALAKPHEKDLISLMWLGYKEVRVGIFKHPKSSMSSDSSPGFCGLGGLEGFSSGTVGGGSVSWT